MPYIRGTSVDFGRDVLWLWQQAGSLRPDNLQVNAQAVSGRVIAGEPREVGIAHSFETDAIVPAFTPSWNTSIPIARINSSRFYPRFSNLPPEKGATIDFTLMRGSSQPVTANARTYTITHNLGDATQVLLVAINWNGIVARGTKTANSMPVRFSVPAPEDGSGLIYYSTQSDETDIYENGEAVAENARTHTITHNSGMINLPMFFLPNWFTNIWFVDRQPDWTTVRFSVPAPAGGGLLDWKIKATTVY